jgi:hypothetical protein
MHTISKTVPGTGEVARFPVDTLGTLTDGNTEHNVTSNGAPHRHPRQRKSTRQPHRTIEGVQTKAASPAAPSAASHYLCCNKVAEAEAAVSVNEENWLKHEEQHTISASIFFPLIIIITLKKHFIFLYRLFFNILIPPLSRPACYVGDAESVQ